MPWQFNGHTPVYLQIVSRIRSDILMGKYQADEQIPAVRQLAFEAAVNPNTMQRALSELEREGLLYTKGTLGRFVTSDENILSMAKVTMHSEAMRNLVSETLSLGITKEELITYIQSLKEGDIT